MAKSWDVIDNHLLNWVIKEWAHRPGQTLGELGKPLKALWCPVCLSEKWE